MLNLEVRRCGDSQVSLGKESQKARSSFGKRIVGRSYQPYYTLAFLTTHTTHCKWSHNLISGRERGLSSTSLPLIHPTSKLVDLL
jgi:hypothetical protein